MVEGGEAGTPFTSQSSPGQASAVLRIRFMFCRIRILRYAFLILSYQNSLAILTFSYVKHLVTLRIKDKKNNFAETVF